MVSCTKHRLSTAAYAALYAELQIRWPFVAEQGDAGVDFLAAYTAPNRYYHDLRHQHHLFEQLDAYAQAHTWPTRVAGNARDQLIQAIWVHDFIQDDAGNNEARSFAAVHAHVPLSTEVERLLLATAHLTPDRPTGGLADVLADIDLSILGASPEAYRTYTEQVRCEYAHVPVSLYRVGRAQVLRAFLKKEPLYATHWAKNQYVTAARRNLSAELAALTA